MRIIHQAWSILTNRHLTERGRLADIIDRIVSSFAPLQPIKCSLERTIERIDKTYRPLDKDRACSDGESTALAKCHVRGFVGTTANVDVRWSRLISEISRSLQRRGERPGLLTTSIFSCSSILSLSFLPVHLPTLVLRSSFFLLCSFFSLSFSLSHFFSSS